jgi:hypothetical protein
MEVKEKRDEIHFSCGAVSRRRSFEDQTRFAKEGDMAKCGISRSSPPHRITPSRPSKMSKCESQCMCLEALSHHQHAQIHQAKMLRAQGFLEAGTINRDHGKR